MKATAIDLRYHTKELLDKVQSGECVEISHRGKSVAKLIPIQSEYTSIGSLSAFGMWADRTDLDNPSEYVRKLRKSRF